METVHFGYSPICAHNVYYVKLNSSSADNHTFTLYPIFFSQDIMFVGYFLHTHTVYEEKCRMFILTQLNINQRQRLWVHTCQPLLYPLQYLIDRLALRSSATQSASLQALKFFYEFWHQKHGVTFCFSFYSSNHNPMIAIDGLTAFFHYLENEHLCVPVLTIWSTTQTTPLSRTNIRHVHVVIRFSCVDQLNLQWFFNISLSISTR